MNNYIFSQEKPLIESILYHHSEDAAFLWQQRDRFVRAPHTYPDDLKKLDRQLAAHLEGLTVADQAGWDLAWQALEAFPEEGEAFVTTALATKSSSRQRFELLQSVIESEPSTQRGFLAALAWTDFPSAKTIIDHCHAHSSPLWQSLGLAATALHRIHPGDDVLNRALNSGNPLLQTRALRAVGELDSKKHWRYLQQTLDDPDLACGFWSAWSMALLGDHDQALNKLCQIAQMPDHPHQHKALSLTLRALPIQKARSLIKHLCQHANLIRQAVMGAGLLGLPESVPFLIEQMHSPSQARIAGHAFCTITGVQLDEDNLEGEVPPEAPEGPNDDPEDDRVDLAFDDDLFWPDAEKVAAWWHRHSSGYLEGQRHLLGKPISEACLTYAFKHGSQIIRRGVALEQVLSGQCATLPNTNKCLFDG